MRFYILDDDINIVKILQNIVETDFERNVVGWQTDPVKAIDEIITLKPDALLIDYLMPVMDGPDVIKRIKAVLPSLEVIMLSQVSDKGMIGDAYSEGLSFFISKPINRIEVNVVLKNLQDRLSSTLKLEQILRLIGHAQVEVMPTDKRWTRAKNVLKDLGISSEKGSKDMVAIIEIMVMDGLLDWGEAFNRYCNKIDDKEKSVRQRIRRAIGKALRNIAYLGVEDYMNETFVKYAHTLFDFETVKHEMDFLRGRSGLKGTLSIDRFIENICDCE